MANMGASRLIVVDPQSPLNDETKQGAAHAQDVLRQAVHYTSLADFLLKEGDGLRIGLSGKDARLKKSDLLNEVLISLQEERSELWLNGQAKIYLMFGAEDDGLTAEEMELCHFICRLPTFGEITSLNLSHAVLLTTYLVQTALQKNLASETAPVQEIGAQPAFFPSKSIHEWLDTLGFDLSAPRINIEKILNRILLSRVPTNDELRILNTVLQQTVRKLKERSSN
jgi:TrmH family RNA methyltransferase